MPDYPVSVTGVAAVPDPQGVTKQLIDDLTARVAALEAGGSSVAPAPPGSTTGDLTVKGKLLVEGEIEIYATRALSSKALTVVIPKSMIGQQAYPHAPKWQYEKADGSREDMSSFVSHRTGTNHENHTSLYVQDDQGNRVSVIDVDTFRPHSTRRVRFENVLVQLGTGTKEAILEAAKQKISGVVRTITRDGNGFIKGS